MVIPREAHGGVREEKDPWVGTSRKEGSGTTKKEKGYWGKQEKNNPGSGHP